MPGVSNSTFNAFQHWGPLPLLPDGQFVRTALKCSYAPRQVYSFASLHHHTIMTDLTYATVGRSVRTHD